MAQKSILSFFASPKAAKIKSSESISAKSPTSKKDEKCLSLEESPETNGHGDVASTSGARKSTDEEKSCSENEGSIIAIPRRKTARKQCPNSKKFLNRSKESEKEQITQESKSSQNEDRVNSVKANSTVTTKKEKINKQNPKEKESSPINKSEKETKVAKVSSSKKQSKKRANRISSDDEEEEEKVGTISSKEVERKIFVVSNGAKTNSKKRKVSEEKECHSSSSSEEDSQINVLAKKKRKRNVIIDDDSPVKQAPVANIFKQAKENYNSKLDKFIMKSKVEDDKDDTTVVTDLLRVKEKLANNQNKNEDSKMEIDEESKYEKQKGVTKEFDSTTEGKNENDENFGTKDTNLDKDLDRNMKSKGNDIKNEKNSSNKSSAAESSYCPSKNNYHPVDDACWKYGEKVPYLALARTFDEIENISGRLKTIETLANFFRSVVVLSPEDLIYSVYLCLNRVAPEYHSLELGVGEMLLMKAMAQATGRTVDKIKSEVASKGDLGLVAESSRANQKVMFGFPKLTICSVFKNFKEIAEMSGNSVMNKKIGIMQKLFSACRDCEAKYIIRSLGGKLRIGLAEQSILTALGQAVTITPPNQDYPPKTINSLRSMPEKEAKSFMDSQVLILKTTYCECPNYDVIMPILLEKGIAELPNHCYLTPGVPLKPMLAHPSISIESVIKRFTKSETKDKKKSDKEDEKVIEFTCEFKYDGERAQIHRLEDGTVKIYSRNQEDNTSKYPDVVERFSKSLIESVKSCILDSEVVAWDIEAQQIQPFQILSTRKRKDAAQSEIKVQVCVVAFDLLYLNGESLIKKTLFERRKLLHESFKEVPNEFTFVKAMDGNDASTMEKFLKDSVEGNCEGLMVKALNVDATYEIAKRSHSWLKLKKDYMGGTADSFDLAVIGGWFGKGKRTGNYGGFLLACYDDDTEEYQTICKIGTGFSDEDLKVHSEFFNQHKLSKAKPDYRYDSSLQPDQWFDTVQIWEVKCADLSISPIHKAASGIVDPEKGISLRFPRFIRIRDDKKLEDTTTAVEVAERYNCQKQIQNQNSKDSKRDIEDFY